MGDGTATHARRALLLAARQGSAREARLREFAVARAEAWPEQQREEGASASTTHVAARQRWRLAGMVALEQRGERFSDIDMARLAEEYKAARAANSDEYLFARKLGEAATRRQAAGRHSFGGSAIATRRALVSRQQTLLALQIGSWSADPASRSIALANYAASADCTVANIVSLARRTKRAETTRRQEAVARSQEALDTFEKGAGSAVVSAIRHSLP